MTIDEMTQRTFIGFEMAIDTDELGKMFSYLARKLDANISYNEVRAKRVYGEREEESAETVGLTVSGSLTLRGVAGIFPFTCGTTTELLINNLKFDYGIEVDIREHRAEQIETWGRVKELISEYFSGCPLF